MTVGDVVPLVMGNGMVVSAKIVRDLGREFYDLDSDFCVMPLTLSKTAIEKMGAYVRQRGEQAASHGLVGQVPNVQALERG